MPRLLAILGSIVLFGLAILAGTAWLPGLMRDPDSVLRWGAGLVLSGGVLLLLLASKGAARNRMLLPAAVVVGLAAWLVPLLARRAPEPPAPRREALSEPAASSRTVIAAPPGLAPEASEPTANPLARELRVPADPSGHFVVRGKVNGTPVVFLIDTGATQVALSDADARRVGLRPLPSQFTHKVATAKGEVMMADATLREVEVGPISVRDVPALVVDSGLGISLLGMSFLGRLESYSVENGVLRLRR